MRAVCSVLDEGEKSELASEPLMLLKMEVQMKIERNRTTTYMTAKKSTGCSAPIDELDLDFIDTDLVLKNNWIGVFPA